MPIKPKHSCSYPECPELTEGRYCLVHQKEMDREYIVVVDHIRNCTTVVDHIKPHKGDEELFYDINNLQPLCKCCHDRKTAKEDSRWGQKGEVYNY
jgi:5-methylcytosine-specific restriction protein A